jgi:hypothetical protein
MEGHFSTGQGPQRAVAPTEEEEGEGEGGKGKRGEEEEEEVFCICVVVGPVSKPSRNVNYCNNASVSGYECLKCMFKSTVILTLHFYPLSILFRLCT